MDELEIKLAFLGKELSEEIIESSSVKTIDADTMILREGEYLAVLPLVINGLIKVYSTFEDKEIFLYYIRPNESCVMSFSSILKNEASRVFAITEEETTMLLLPANKIELWNKHFPQFTKLFFQLYELRYLELLTMLQKTIFENLDKRLFDYLKEKALLTETQTIKITHREIANDLGTAREVISRLLKKLEHEEKIEQIGNSIKLLAGDKSH